ncbi:putative transcriptional regulator [Halobacterium salinarum]|uniref:Putative transcriptional regulator n=2 Tax=Halobacterium salinarum TaxID=2242 RepID=A0A841HDA0_HALSI|nr:putative transcriptional regulator [Halobacterium salinarum]
MAEQLRHDMTCDGLLECFHGLKQLDKGVFQALVTTNDALTVDDIAERVDRERSTAYRAVQRLLSAGLIQKEQINYDQGGYHSSLVKKSRDSGRISSLCKTRLRSLLIIF